MSTEVQRCYTRTYSCHKQALALPACHVQALLQVHAQALVLLWTNFPWCGSLHVLFTIQLHLGGDYTGQLKWLNLYLRQSL